MILTLGLDGFAHKIGMNRQLAVPPVNKHQQLHPLRAAVVKNGAPVRGRWT